MSAPAGERWRGFAALYLAAQAIAGLVWWLLLFTAPAARSWFELDPNRRSALDAFFLPDLVIFVGGSALSAWTIWRRSRWATFVCSLTAGGVVYATVYLVGWVAMERTAAAGVAPMAVAGVVTTSIAVRTWKDSDR